MSTSTSDNGSALAKFSTWCPKLVAAIGKLPDTLADRCILIRMQRKTQEEECQRVRFLDTEALRRQCLRFVNDHRADVAGAEPTIPAGLNDRAADVWEPLLAIADIAGDHWPETARQAAVSLTATAQENNPIGSLLFDIFVLFATSNADRLFSRNLAEGLNRFADRPWMEVNKGREINEPWLAQQLRPYGLRPRTMRIADQRAKGYFFEDFREIFRRYIPRSELDELKRPDQDNET